MAECRHCGATVDDTVRFCPMCMTPQTEEATRRLEAYLEGDAGSRGTRGDSTGADSLERRVRYATGYVAIVAGLSTLLDGGILFLLAGVAVLPPVQRLVEERIDRPLGTVSTVGAAGALGVAGAVLLVVT